MKKTDELFLQMARHDSGNPKRIQHFTKVHAYARLLGLLEGLDDATQEILEAAALVHDIGIKPALEKHQSSMGKLQELEGPEPARQMLTSLGFEDVLIERVCYLVAHHHTYTNMDGMDYQILVEADFLVNLFEKAESKETLMAAYQNIFRTGSGKALFKTMFGL